VGRDFFRSGELAPEDERRAKTRRSKDKRAYADGRREIWQRRGKNARTKAAIAPPAGGDYCSDECSFNEEDSDTGCNCGHDECAEKAVAVSPGDW
jgi:hypothetical protein